MEEGRAHDTSVKIRGAARENQPRLTLVPRVSGAPAPRVDPLRWVYAAWAICAVALFALHFPHLLADFPNNSPWLDPSKYTDEGWYGNAAVRHFVIGHWFLRGDFNPAIALPVWPILLGLLFHFTGVSLTADRALDLVVFGINLLLVYQTVRTQAARWVGLLAVTLLVSSPFLYAFSRLAILEPPLMCLLLLSWILARRLPRASARAQRVMLAAIGLLICLMILTKTTAVFILPSTLWLIAHAYGLRWNTLRALLLTGVAAAVPWCAYYFLFVRPHYRADYQYLFAANHWPQPTGFKGHVAAFWYALHGSLWISPTLCIVALVLLALTLIPARKNPADDSLDPPLRLWPSPITIASLLTCAGYLFFIGWQNNPQPRYYETVIYPLCFVLVLRAADLVSRSRPVFLRLCGGAAITAMVVVSLAGIGRIVSYVRHPEYTWLNAAQGITRYIDHHPGPNRLLLSISGDQIEMITGLPSICDDYGSWDLPYRVHVYQPGWFAAWNDLDPGTILDLSTQYSLEQVASLPAFDDPDRNLLVLYRMIPLPPSKQTYAAQEEAANNAGK